MNITGNCLEQNGMTMQMQICRYSSPWLGSRSRAVCHQSQGWWLDSRPLQSTCRSWARYWTLKVARSGSSISACMRMSGYQSWWAGVTLHGSLCHQCMNMCRMGELGLVLSQVLQVFSKTIRVLYKYSPFTKCKSHSPCTSHQPPALHAKAVTGSWNWKFMLALFSSCHHCNHTSDLDERIFQFCYTTLLMYIVRCIMRTKLRYSGQCKPKSSIHWGLDSKSHQKSK